MATGVVASSVAYRSSQLLMAATLSVAIVAGHQLFLTLKKPRALRIVSWFTLTLLVGGIVGLLYSLFVNQPLLAVQVGYQTTYLYLTTFSFAQIGNFIRPSGIFDEPGAFAMYVVIVTMFNDTLQQNRSLNFVMIVLLIFTGSLAGLFIAFLYFLVSNSTRASVKTRLVLAALFVGASLLLLYVLPTNPLGRAVNTFYSERLQVVDGRLVGDNRSNQISNFFALVNDEIILRGAKAARGGYNYFSVDESSNPFSITFAYGLIISLPYFVLLLWLAVTTFRNRFRNSYTSIGLLLLLLQRPYIYDLSWSIMIASAAWLVRFSSHNRESRWAARQEARSAH